MATPDHPHPHQFESATQRCCICGCPVPSDFDWATHTEPTVGFHNAQISGDPVPQGVIQRGGRFITSPIVPPGVESES